MTVSRYTLAVDRGIKNGDAKADFIRCVAFGKSGEFVEKYLRKGMKVAIIGRIQTGSYKDRDGKTVYTTDVVVENHEFAESRQGTSPETQRNAPKADEDGFMSIPDGIDEELPFG